MNKIIVVGHPYSGYEEIEKLLMSCGMKEALPSRREGFMPAQISETLVKAHGAIPVQKIRSADPLQQIDVGPVWQGMVLDLMLANMDQSLWGWSDIQAIYLLEYWKIQDPQIVFVLVFDEPQSVFTRLPLNQASTTSEEQDARLNAWVAYNSALLNFHLRSPERSLLVHARQVKTAAQSSLQKISARINASLQLPGDTWPGKNPDESDRLDQDSIVLQKKNKQVPALWDQEEKNLLTDWLVQQLLEEYPQATELYEELQAAASLPHRRNSAQNFTGLQLAANRNEEASHRQKAWSAFVAQQMALQERAERINVLQQQVQESESTIALLGKTKTELERQVKERSLLLEHLGKAHDEQAQLAQQYQVQIEQLSQAKVVAEQQMQERQHLLMENSKAFHALEANKQQLKAEFQQQLQKAHASLKSSEQENHLLLEQLHKVQEELEHYYLQEKQLSQAKATAEKQVQELIQQLEKLTKACEEQAMWAQEREAQLNTLTRAKAIMDAQLQEQTQQLGQMSKVCDEQTKLSQQRQGKVQQLEIAQQASQQEARLLLEQLHKVQEELEHQYLRVQQQEKSLADLPKIKIDLRNSQEKVKQLQQTEIIANKLKAELQNVREKAGQLESYQKQVSKLQEELKALQSKAEQLQQSEVNLKKQLQDELTKVPAVSLKNENELLLSQLHKVQEELERYYIDNCQLKAEILKSKPKEHRGAANRIKQQLPYRLGALMISKSGSVKGVMSMPWILRAEEQRIREEMRANGDDKLPPIGEYWDAHEAEKVKRHLSYRLGSAWVMRTQSLGGWFTLPWALYTEIKAFRKDRK